MHGCPTLTHREGVSIDADRLVELFCALGEGLAERRIAEALDLVAAGIPVLTDALASADRDGFLTRVLAVSRQADTIGLTTLSRVAADVADSCDRSDGHALAATLARLRRIGDRSLAEICDLHRALR